MDWVYYGPRTDVEYSIEVFDDGNEKYAQYTNVWLAYGDWRGKVALVNKYDRSVKISSISAWKAHERAAFVCD